MGRVDNRDCRVTITVRDEQTGERYDTRAFPTGQGPGLFSAPVSIDRDMHWIHISIEEGRIHVVGGNKVPGDAFQLAAVHDSRADLEAGVATVEYVVQDRFSIEVFVEVVARRFGEARPDTSSAEAMAELLEKGPPTRHAAKPKTRSAGQVRTLMRALGFRRPSSDGR